MARSDSFSGTEPIVLPYFAVLGLDEDQQFLEAHKQLHGVFKRQFDTAAQYVPVKEEVSKAEEAHKATQKYKEQDEAVRVATAKKKGPAKPEEPAPPGEKTKLGELASLESKQQASL